MRWTKIGAIVLGVAVGAASLASAAFLAPQVFGHHSTDQSATAGERETHHLVNTGGSTNPCQCTHRIER